MHKQFTRNVLCAAVAVAVVQLSSSAHAAAIFGGPVYDATTQTGYYLPTLVSTAGNGTAVGYATKYASGSDMGNRAVRWDASGAAAIELGHLGTDDSGVTDSRARAINTAGTAVGYAIKYDSGVSKGNHAVRWDASGTAATELGHLGTDSSGVTDSRAHAINTVGTSVGSAEKYESGVSKGNRAVRWDASGTAATELGHLATDSSGYTFSEAYAINDAGTAVGVAAKHEADVDDGNRAVRWDASGTAATELGHLGLSTIGYTYSAAYAINAAGTAVGSAEKYESGSEMGIRAVRWDASGTAATELGHLGTIDGHTISEAYAINDAGTAVGYAWKSESDVSKGIRAVRWDASGTAATELGHLGTDANGYTTSRAYAINAAGIAVGFAQEYDLSGAFLGQRAVAWGLDGVAIDLNTLLGPDDAAGWLNLFQAASINDAGWVTGLGTYDPDGAGPLGAYTRMFLLDASSLIPEPASLSLLALGGMVMLRRRRA